MPELAGQALALTYMGAVLAVGIVALVWGNQHKLTGAGLLLASVLASNILDSLFQAGVLSLRALTLVFAVIDLLLATAFTEIYRRSTRLQRHRWALAAAMVHLLMVFANVVAASAPSFAQGRLFPTLLNVLLVSALVACLAGMAPKNRAEAFGVPRLKFMYFMSDLFGFMVGRGMQGRRMLMKTKRRPGAAAGIDAHIGARVREARILLDMSREDLAAAMGVTVAQVQKYETGATRLSASAVFELAQFLKQDLSFFFSGYRPLRPGVRRPAGRART